MEKTLTKIMFEITQKHDEVRELESKRESVYVVINDLKNEICDRFKPRWWEGQEFIITSSSPAPNYPMDTLNYMNKGGLPFRKHKTPGLKNTHIGRKFRCDEVRLVTAYKDNQGYFIHWQMVGKIKLSSGDYGRVDFTFDFIDKVEIEK